MGSSILGKMGHELLGGAGPELAAMGKVKAILRPLNLIQRENYSALIFT